MESNWKNTSIKTSVSPWVKDVVWLLYILSILYGGVLYIFWGLLGIYYFGKVNVIFASRINGNKDFAFAVGALIGFFGVVLYWIYYMLKRK